MFWGHAWQEQIREVCRPKQTISCEWGEVLQARSKRSIFISKRKYVLDLLIEVRMLDCKPINIPTIQNHKLKVYPDQEQTYKKRYQRLVGWPNQSIHVLS